MLESCTSATNFSRSCSSCTKPVKINQVSTHDITTSKTEWSTFKASRIENILSKSAGTWEFEPDWTIWRKVTEPLWSCCCFSMIRDWRFECCSSWKDSLFRSMRISSRSWCLWGGVCCSGRDSFSGIEFCNWFGECGFSECRAMRGVTIIRCKRSFCFWCRSISGDCFDLVLNIRAQCFCWDWKSRGDSGFKLKLLSLKQGVLWGDDTLNRSRCLCWDSSVLIVAEKGWFTHSHDLCFDRDS